MTLSMSSGGKWCPPFFSNAEKKKFNWCSEAKQDGLNWSKCFLLWPRTFKVTRFDKEQFWMCTFEFLPIFKIREIQS